MIILDTNVVSEVMKPNPEPAVKDWLDAQPEETLWLSSVTVFEIMCGIESLPTGKRKTGLADAFNELLQKDFDNRVLAFDEQHAPKGGRNLREASRSGTKPGVPRHPNRGSGCRFRRCSRNEKHPAFRRNGCVIDESLGLSALIASV